MEAQITAFTQQSQKELIVVSTIKGNNVFSQNNSEAPFDISEIEQRESLSPRENGILVDPSQNPLLIKVEELECRVHMKEEELKQFKQSLQSDMTSTAHLNIIEEQNITVVSLKSQLAGQQYTIEALTVINVEEKNKFDELNAKFDQQSAKFDKMQADFDTCQDSLFKVEEANTELQASNKTLYAEVYQLRTKIAELQQSSSAKKERRGRASRLVDTSQITEQMALEEPDVKQEDKQEDNQEENEQEEVADGESSLEEVPLVPASDHDMSIREIEVEECAEDN